MFSAKSSRLTRIALAVSCIAISASSPGWAQTVRVFDEAPPIEVLRGIMVPESMPGANRSIVIQKPDTGPAAAVQRVATGAPASPAPESAPKPAIKPAAHAKPSTEAKPGTVGFRINFAFDSAALPASSHKMIDTVAEVMKETPSIRVRVEGHTDAVGTANYNNDLSERRALAVGTYLTTHGIDPSRIELIGKGMSEPLVKDPYDAQNRRVQFVRIG